MTDIFNIMALIVSIVVIIFFFMVFLLRSDKSEERSDFMEEVRKTALLDLEVHVAHGENLVYLMFGIGIIMIAFIIPVMISSITDRDESSFGFFVMGLFFIAMSLLLVLFFWPFARKGRLFITGKLVVLPAWKPRPLSMEPSILRIENIEYVNVNNKGYRKMRVESYSFHGRAYGTLRLSRKDHDKYTQIYDRLKSLGVEVRG